MLSGLGAATRIGHAIQRAAPRQAPHAATETGKTAPSLSSTVNQAIVPTRWASKNAIIQKCGA
jgi:hypothetical protein